MQAFSIGRLSGIAIRIHPTFFILPLAFGVGFGWSSQMPMIGVRAACAILLIFVCVLGHELSHALCAKQLGIRVPTITFYPMGGVAELHHIPRKPSEEAKIAIAGPLFNFLLVAVLYFPLGALIGPGRLHDPDLGSWGGMLANVFWANLILGGFNLIPAFPMDGGRLFRAFLSWKLRSHEKATRISAFLGRFFAIGFILLGLRWHTWMLVLVGFYVFRAASREGKTAVSNTPQKAVNESSDS